jgi:hypothetical protein
MRTITIVNQQTAVPAADIPPVLAAIQNGLDAAFLPAYGLAGVQLPLGPDPGGNAERIYLLNNTAQADVLGYHTLLGQAGVGYVFTETAIAYGDQWSATLDHEVKEQIIDVACNLGVLAVLGGAAAFVIREVADPVENSEYALGGVALSNFVLLSWFVPASAGPWDYLGQLNAPLTLLPGGYVAYTTDFRSWHQLFGDRTPTHQRHYTKYSRRARRRKRGP